jgi:hypothetical protein
MKVADIQKRIAEKVTGVWIPEHDEHGHHYRNTKTGEVVDSVTTKNIIDKPHLIPWSIRLAIEYLEKPGNFELLQTDQRANIIKAAQLQGRDAMNEAGSVGSIAHDAIEKYVKFWIKTGEKPKDIKSLLNDDDDPRAFAAARSAEKFFNEHLVTPVATEFIVGKEGEGAGTLDLLVVNDKGKLELIDWKTSNSIDDFYSCQVATYKRYFTHMTGLKIVRARVVKLEKSCDSYKVYDIVNNRESYEIFRACTKIYDWQHDGKKKLVEPKNVIVI